MRKYIIFIVSIGFSSASWSGANSAQFANSFTIFGLIKTVNQALQNSRKTIAPIPNKFKQEQELLKERRQAKTDKEFEAVEEKLQQIRLGQRTSKQMSQNPTEYSSHMHPTADSNTVQMPPIWSAPQAGDPARSSSGGGGEESAASYNYGHLNKNPPPNPFNGSRKEEDREFRFKDPRAGRMTIRMIKGTWEKYQESLIFFNHLTVKKDGANAVIQYINGNQYQGPVNEENKPHGEGKITLKDGTLIQGTWTNNDITEGEITFKDGSQYKGFVDSDYKSHGIGTLTLKDGTGISGDFSGGNITSGKIQYPCGNMYHGPIQNHLAHGQGNLILVDGETLSGNFDKGYVLEIKIQDRNLIFKGRLRNKFNPYEKFDFNLFASGYMATLDSATGKILVFKNGEFEKGRLIKGLQVINGNDEQICEIDFKNHLCNDGKVIFLEPKTRKTIQIQEGIFEDFKLLEGTKTKFSPQTGEKIHIEKVKIRIEGEFRVGKIEILNPITGEIEETQEGRFKGGQLIEGSTKGKDGRIYPLCLPEK